MGRSRRCGRFVSAPKSVCDLFRSGGTSSDAGRFRFDANASVRRWSSRLGCLRTSSVCRKGFAPCGFRAVRASAFDPRLHTVFMPHTSRIARFFYCIRIACGRPAAVSRSLRAGRRSDGLAEAPCDLERQYGRGYEPARFDGIDRLAAHADGVGQLLLRHPHFGALDADSILHRAPPFRAATTSSGRCRGRAGEIPACRT